MSLSAVRNQNPVRSHLGVGSSDKSSNDGVRRDDRTFAARPVNQPVVLEPHWQASIENATD